MQLFGKLVHAHAERFKKFLEQNLTGVNWWQLLRTGPSLWLPSMIVDDLDIVSVALAPHETDSPLIVDPDAVLTVVKLGIAKQREPRARAAPAVSCPIRAGAERLKPRGACPWSKSCLRS